MEQPVILCGLGRVGQRVLECLQAAGMSVVVVDDRCAAGDPRLGAATLVRGDFRDADVLARAGLDRARGVLILSSDDLANISATLLVRHLNPSVRVVVRLFNENLIHRLGQAVSNTFALSVSRLTAPLLALTALAGQAVATFRAGGAAFQVAELAISERSPLRGRTVADAAAGPDVIPVAHLAGRGRRLFLREVDAAARLDAGDALVICAEREQLEPLMTASSEESLPHLYWAGWLRRMGRVVWRWVAEADPAVKVCTAVFLGVLAGSTLVYCFWMEKSIAEALYRTVSLIATAAPLPPGQEAGKQVFVSVLRVLGAVLIAAFTAIFTNYLLRARLGGALEVRRIPDAGHVIVCGLGNLGYRVVEELLQAGERVVVIDPQRDGRFMAPVRRLGVATIVGDATVLEVLRLAHSPTARAVVAATSDELVNLEIALLARELNPQARVVLRLNDATLAQTLRDAARIRFAMCVPALAAPAFVAALYGDRVQGVFQAGGRLFAVVELVAQAGDAFLVGQGVRALAADYGLVPACLVAADGTRRPNAAEQTLAEGDRLTVIASLPDLERLVRRERPPADCAVEVVGYAPSARAFVLSAAQAQLGLAADAAEAQADRLPFRLCSGLTRGQAEDAVARLTREGVKAEVRPADSGR